MVTRIAIVVQFVLALSIFYLGYTIHSTSNKVSHIIEVYPEILKDIDSLANTLQVEDWLKVAEVAEQMIPDVMKSVDQVSKSITAINQTAASIDEKVPSVLNELTHYRVEVFPAIVTEASSYRKDVIPPVLEESQGYRQTTIPMLVRESTNLRSDIPLMLAKADEIVDQSQELAEQVTSGAVKGVIMSPINLIKDAGSQIKGKIRSEELPTSE